MSINTDGALLATPQVRLLTSNGSIVHMRVLCDTGAQVNLVSQEFVRQQRIPTYRVATNITPAAGTAIQRCDRSISGQLMSVYSEEPLLTIACLVVPTVLGEVVLPQQRVQAQKLPSQLLGRLADPAFDKPSPVQALLGVGVWARMMQERIQSLASGLMAQESRLGWLVFGEVTTEIIPTVAASIIESSEIQTDARLDKLLQAFFESEGPSDDKTQWTEEQQRCETHFLSTHRFESQISRYVLRIPLKDNWEQIGTNRAIALQRYLRLEQRLNSDPELKEKYEKVMDEYLEKGWLQAVTRAPKGPSYYIPHHAVLKKFRVVFDASCSTNTGLSLNDVQMIGPKLQRDLVDLICGFRLRAFGVSADIKQMYPQIKISTEDWDLQRIFWRNDSDSMAEFWLTGVTFGKAGGDLFNANVPASILGLGWDTDTDELTFKIEVLPSTRSGWTKRSVLSVIARLYDPVGLAAPFTILAKTLLQRLWKSKLGWDERSDDILEKEWTALSSQILQFNSLRIPRWVGLTKQSSGCIHGFSDASMLAYGAAVYLTVTNGGSVTSNLLLAKSRVAPLKAETIPRLELRAAVLLSELMERVVSNCEREHQVNIDSAICWSDSMVVVCWINRESGSLRQFVANRVRQIKEKTANCEWKYVPSRFNPADLISRGLRVSELAKSELWWHGPPFLRWNKEAWPKPPDNASVECEGEVQRECRKIKELNPDATLVMAGGQHRSGQKSNERQLVASVNAINLNNQPLLYRYSSISRLTRVTAWILRFSRNCRAPTTERLKGPLSVTELEGALQHWIRQEQRDHYKSDIVLLEQSEGEQKIPSKGRHSNAISMLAPFLEDGVLRMHGRLQNADLRFEERNPAILPGKGRLAWLLARDMHIKMLHCGAQQLIAGLRKYYWIVGARSLTRTLVKDCIICEKLKARVCQQIMGDLPACRVRPARPFLNAGVDYAGPILVKPNRGRGNTTIKGYIAVFVCMVSKAVHLEFVSDLTTNAFIMAFIRFTSRFGHCRNLWSDNGTNFVGAEKELGRMLQSWKTADIYEELAARQTQWHFITPSAPHQGGLWEAAVKAMKHHLRRVMGGRLLTVEAVQTLLAEIGAILNSRPLCAQSADPGDLAPLTPGHLLIGEALVPVQGGRVEPERPQNLLNYWHARQQIVQRFWTLWRESYLHELQQRSKWKVARANLRVGDLVIVKNEATPPSLWRTARVTELHPGKDDRVRNVTIWTGHRHITRPVQRLCVLPVEPVEPRVNSSLKAGGC